MVVRSGGVERLSPAVPVTRKKKKRKKKYA